MLSKVLDMPTGGVDIQKEDQEIKEQNAKKNAEINGKTIVTEIRYSLMNEKPFAENVDEIIHMSDGDARTNAKEGNFVSIMKHTPAVILDNVEGAEDLEVIIRFDALYLASREEGALEGHYHALGAEITKQLPELISNPDAIVRMDNGRLNIFAEMSTAKGNNGIIAIELNTVKDINSKNTKYNLVVSAFSAKDNYVRSILQKRADSVEYMKKDLSQVNHQLYEWLATVNERSDGSSTTTNSIRDNAEKVNNKVENSGERFSLSSIANTFFGNPDMSADDFSKANYKETKAYKSYVKQCLNNMRQTRKNFNENTAKKEIEDAIDGIIRVAVAAKKAGYDIYDNPSEQNVRDSKDRLLFSSLEPNNDFFTSSDISTICDKRKNFTQIYEDIVRLEEEKGVPKGKRFFDNVAFCK